MKIKVIDLLNIMADGKELPEKFMYNEHLYYRQKMKGICYRSDELDEIFEECLALEDLNDTIEIIEEPKKIGKISWRNQESLAGEFTVNEKQDILARRTEKLKSSLNELIDEINNLKREKNE